MNILTYFLCFIWGCVTAACGYVVVQNGTIDPRNLLIVLIGTLIIVFVMSFLKKLKRCE